MDTVLALVMALVPGISEALKDEKLTVGEVIGLAEKGLKAAGVWDQTLVSLKKEQKSA